jgi:glucose-1-phosphatase
VTGISLILFDLNGVLYRYDRDARIAHLARLSGHPPGAILAAIWESGFEDSGDAGTLDADAYLRGFGERLGCSLTEADWVAAQRAAVTPIAATQTLLQRIRPGVQLAVLTNNNLLVRKHFSAFYPEITAQVGDRAHVSAEFGARKPDPQAYLRCLDRLGTTPAQALFIDDSPDNVAGARQAGLDACHYSDPAILAADLRERGVL